MKPIFSIRASSLIKVNTIRESHVNQLVLEHYWPWDSPKHYSFDFDTVEIIGRMAKTNDLLCQNPDGSLRLINCCAFHDWAFAKVGGVLPSGEYAPVPHTEYSLKAKELFNAIPQIFTSPNGELAREARENTI